MKGKRKFLYIFILALILLYLLIYVLPSVTGWLSPTETIEAGNLQVGKEVDCYFVRDEKVYDASAGGTLHYLVKEGERVRKNIKIVELTPDGSKLKDDEKSDYSTVLDELAGADVKTESCRAGFSGVIGVTVDGYENYFTPKKLESLTFDKVSQLNMKEISLARSSTYSGEPIYKICEDGLWYMVYWVDTGDMAKYETNEKVTVSLKNGDVDAKVYKISQDGNKWKVILKCNDYYKNFAKTRKETAQIVSKAYSGLLVNNECITTKSGDPGVYVKDNDGDYNFVRINVIATNGEQSVVSDTYFYDKDGKTVNTVEVYDEIKKNPDSGD